MSKVKITLAHGMTIDGKYRGPGTEITVDKDEAGGLEAAGMVDNGGKQTIADVAAEAGTSNG